MKVSLFIFSLILPIFIYAGPIVTSVTPTTGTVAGGDLVQITGSGFTGATAVQFGTLSAAPFAVASDTTIYVLAPETIVAGTIDVAVTTGSGTSPLSSANEYTYTQGDWYLYASLNAPSNFCPVNLRTNLLGTALTLQDISSAMSIIPDGQSLFAIPIGFLDLMHVDLAANQDLPTIPTGAFADVIAISPDGKTAYITTTSPHAIQTMDIVTLMLGSTIPLLDFPLGIAITPDGKTAYVASPSGVYPVNLSLGIVGLPFLVPQGSSIQITPDGTKAFITDSAGPNATYIDLVGGIAYNSIAIGAGTQNLAINPDGKTVYFVLENNTGFVPVDVATLSVGSTVSTFPYAVATIAVTPDGKTAYLGGADENIEGGLVIPVDLTSYTPLPPVFFPGSVFTQSIVISPDQAPIASFISQVKLPGLVSTFDASASFSPVGFIAQYDWDFGDGNTLTTDIPLADHIYETSGTFTVTLTVTNSAGTSTTQVFTGQTMSRNGGPSARTTQNVVVIPLFPPENAKGFQIENHFLTQTEIQNKLVWSPPSQGNSPVAYNIFSDAGLTQLIAIVPAGGNLRYVQHNVHHRAYIYYIVSIDASGNQSAPLVVLVRPAEEE